MILSMDDLKMLTSLASTAKIDMLIIHRHSGKQQALIADFVTNGAYQAAADFTNITLIDVDPYDLQVTQWEDQEAFRVEYRWPMPEHRPWDINGVLMQVPEGQATVVLPNDPPELLLSASDYYSVTTSWDVAQVLRKVGYDTDRKCWLTTLKTPVDLHGKPVPQPNEMNWWSKPDTWSKPASMNFFYGNSLYIT